MKFLIWFLCSLIFGSIIALCAMLEFSLGGIPTILLAFGTFWLARKLCKIWDSRKPAEKRHSAVVAAPTKPTSSASSDTKPEAVGCTTNAEKETAYKKPCIIFASLSALLLAASLVLGTAVFFQNRQIDTLTRESVEFKTEIVTQKDISYNEGYADGKDDGTAEGYFHGYLDATVKHGLDDIASSIRIKFITLIKDPDRFAKLYEWLKKTQP